ncbi:MAG TPA: glutathione S-transferase family protein [Gammaproteobacteria bacterium]
MSRDLVFYHNPMSRARIVHWMLEEVEASYEVELIRFDKNEHKAPEYLAINPMGKLPAIVHRGTVVTESAAICAYLADAFPDAGLAPNVRSPDRGTYYRWLFFAAGCLEPALVDKMLDRPDPGRPSAIGYGTYRDTLDTLEQAVAKGPYLLGERFTAADLYVASQIGWGLMTKALEPRPALVDYSTRCTERPAAKRAAAREEEFVARLKAAG